MQTLMRFLAGLLFAAGALFSQFDYDAKQPFDTACEALSKRSDAELVGCGFSGVRGGRVNFILVKPTIAKPPFAGVIFQHGGGQSMTNVKNGRYLFCPNGSHLAIYDDQKVYVGGIIDFLRDVDAAR